MTRAQNFETVDDVLEDTNKLPSHWSEVWSQMIGERIYRKSYSRWTNADILHARKCYEVLQAARAAAVLEGETSK